MSEFVQKGSVIAPSNSWTEPWPGFAYSATSRGLDIIPEAFGPYTRWGVRPNFKSCLLIGSSDEISGGPEAIPVESSTDNRASLGYSSIFTVESTTTDVTTSDIGLTCPSRYTNPITCNLSGAHPIVAFSLSRMTSLPRAGWRLK
jgi:hypothetical protein